MWRMLGNNQMSMFDSTDEDLYYLYTIQEAAEMENRISNPVNGGGREIIKRDFQEAHQRVWDDYFCPSPKYPEKKFRRRFRMSRVLFLRIHDAVVAYDSYFVQKRNGARKLGLSSILKVTAAQRILASGAAADLYDKYLQIGESTATKCLIHFVKAVVEVFGAEYLRSPNANDIARLMHINEERGFPGMLGSLDCMHWQWKNCPTGWAGQYSGHIQTPTIILEAVASQDLWIWHAFFGLPGSHNDINVLEHSPLFNDLTQGNAPPVHFTINGHSYDMGYYLADGIYPQWATLVKTISHPNNKKKSLFAERQESMRKDIERAFGVLQARWHIIRDPVRFHDISELALIMKACIILHNMIVEEEKDMYKNAAKGSYYLFKEARPPPLDRHHTLEINRWIENRNRMRNREQHSQLQTDLVEHLWERQGSTTA